MLAEQRRLKILELLREEGSARVRDLSKTFSVSEPTIRQDLEKLEAGGTITREHGGAFLKSVPQQVQAMSLEHLDNMEKKHAIGRKAAQFVDHGETIILDAGSTTTEMVDYLAEKQNLKVMTNALNIVLRLGAIPGPSYDLDEAGLAFCGLRQAGPFLLERGMVQDPDGHAADRRRHRRHDHHQKDDALVVGQNKLSAAEPTIPDLYHACFRTRLPEGRITGPPSHTFVAPSPPSV